MLWECFKDRASLQEHIAKDYTQDYFATARAFMSQPTEVIELSKFS
jgi:quinol monooxygenase YgiN